MNLEAIGLHLAASGCGVMKKTIFGTAMPAECLEGILLIGNYYGTPLNHYLPGYLVTEFRLIARSADYNRGEALALKASAALTIQAGMQLSGIMVTQCLPLNLPRPYRRSVGAFHEFEVDIAIHYTTD